MGKHFDFEAFDKLIGEALGEFPSEAEVIELEQRMDAHDTWAMGDGLASPVEPVTDWPTPPEAA